MARAVVRSGVGWVPRSYLEVPVTAGLACRARAVDADERHDEDHIAWQQGRSNVGCSTKQPCGGSTDR